MKASSYQEFKHWGTVLDLPPEEVPPDKWTSVANIQFQEQSTRRVGGYAAFGGTPGTPPIFALNALNGADTYWLYCGVS